MNDIFCQLCNVNILTYHMELHVGGKKHKARQSKETFEQEIARSVVLQGFNPESPLKFSELQEIFQQFGHIEGFRTHTASQEVDVRFYNNRDAKKALSAGRFVFYRNDKFQIYKKFYSGEERGETLKCPPPPEISEHRQALLPPPSQGIDPSYASSCQLIQPVHSAHPTHSVHSAHSAHPADPDAYMKDWKIKYRTEYQDTRVMDRSGQIDSRGKSAKHDPEDRYPSSAYRSNELTDSRNLYSNSSSRELTMHDSRKMEGGEFYSDHRTSHEIGNQVFTDSSFSQRKLKGASGVQDYRYQMTERNHVPAESQNHSLPFHQSDGRDKIMLTESITHLPTLSKYVSGFASQAVGRNQIVSSSLFHGQDVDDRKSDVIVQSANSQIYLPDSHYQDLRQPSGPIRNHRSHSRDAVAPVQALRYQTRTDLDSQGSRNTMLDYNRSPRDAVDDTHFGSAEGPRNSVPDYNRPRDAIEDNYIRTTRGPRAPIPEYNRSREEPDDGHNRKTTQGLRNSVLDYNRPRDLIDDNHTRTTQGLRNSELNYNKSKDGADNSHDRTVQDSRNLLADYKRPRDVEDNHRSTQGPRNSEPHYKRGRDLVEDSHISTQGSRNSKPDYKRGRDLVEDNHRSTQSPINSESGYKRASDIVGDIHRSTQGPRNSEPEYKRARDTVEDSHRSTQGPRNSEPEYKRARDIVEDSRRSTQGPRNTEPEYKRARDIVEDNHRSTQDPRNSEPEYKRGRVPVEDSYRSTQGSRNSESEYKRAGAILEDNHRSIQGPRNSEPEYKRARDTVEDSHRSSQGSRNLEPEYKRGRDLVEDSQRSTQGSRNLEPEYKRGRDLVEDSQRSTQGPRNLEPEYKRGRDLVEDSQRSTQGPRNLEPEYKRGRDLVEDSQRSAQGPRNSEPDYKRARNEAEHDHHRKSSEGHKNSVPNYSRPRDGANNAPSGKSCHSSRAKAKDYSQPREESGDGKTMLTKKACMLRPLYLNKTSDSITREKKLSPVRILTPLVKENKDSPLSAVTKPRHITNIMLSLDLKGNLDQQMTSFMYELRRYENDSMKVNHALTDVERAMQYEYPGCRVLPCGANVTGLFLSETFVDLYLEFTTENKSKIAGSEIAEGRREKTSSRITAEILNTNETFVHVRAYPAQRSPMVELHHLPTAFLVHISFKAWTLAKDELLKFLISTDKRLRQVFMFIKYWAAVHLDNMGRCKPSKYYLMLLVIFYLQRLPKPVLPPIQFLQKDSSYDKFVDGWNIGFNNSLLNVPKNENISSVKTLLEGFFEFYSKFKFEDLIISPFVGDAIPSQAFLRANLLPATFDVYKSNLLNKSKGSFQFNNFINVQDPFEHNYNASMHFNLELRNLFQSKCKSTLSLFQECHRAGTDKGLLNRIFLCDHTIVFVDNKEMYRISVRLPMDKQVAVSEECAMLTYVRLNKLLANMLTDVLKSKFTCVKDITYNSEGALCSPEAKYVCELFFNLWSSRSNNQSEPESNSIIERETGVSDKIINSLYRNQKPACPILVFNLNACIKIKSKSICLNFTCVDTFLETFREFFRVCRPIFTRAIKRLADRVDDH